MVVHYLPALPPSAATLSKVLDFDRKHSARRPQPHTEAPDFCSHQRQGTLEGRAFVYKRDTWAMAVSELKVPPPLHLPGSSPWDLCREVNLAFCRRTSPRR